jgi:hypothetical protein
MPVGPPPLTGKEKLEGRPINGDPNLAGASAVDCESPVGGRLGGRSKDCCDLIWEPMTLSPRVEENGSLESDAGAIGLVSGSLHISDGRLGRLVLRGSMFWRPDRRFWVLERLRFSLAGDLRLRRGPSVWL